MSTVDTKDHTPEAVKTVSIVPDYRNLVTMYSKDFKTLSGCLETLNLDTHTDVHGMLASLNVAMQAVTSTDEFVKLRDLFGEVVSKSSENLREKQQEADDLEFEDSTEFANYQ